MKITTIAACIKAISVGGCVTMEQQEQMQFTQQLSPTCYGLDGAQRAACLQNAAIQGQQAAIAERERVSRALQDMSRWAQSTSPPMRTTTCTPLPLGGFQCHNM